MDEDRGLYPISVIADIIGEHPETLRVWERNGLITPDRSGYQRRYSAGDMKRLQFIKYMIDEKGFNVASLSHLLNMYPCWYKVGCKGGMKKGCKGINSTRPCWKEQDTYCIKVADKADMCCCCIREEENDNNNNK